MSILKVVLTSKSNLSLKYGSKFAALKKVLAALVASDKKQLITTKIVYIDDAASCKALGMKPVTAMKEKPCKDFVDVLYKKHTPAYIVLFGAQDIFPFQELKNDLYQPGDDDDQAIPSDLPYACNSGYSKKVNTFIDPVRVVGRIPDMPGKADLEFVSALLQNVIKQKPIDKKYYQKYFAVSAEVWKDSTRESINNIFGNTEDLLYSPPAKGGYPKSKLKALSHFYNCHGALLDPNYYGQEGSSYPVALKSKDVNGKITFGAVVAAECCYGVQLIEPDVAPSSVASNYMLNGSISFMGSSTIAYGPATGQGLADLICQYFIINVHEGASSGRALLEARQKFLNVSGPNLDPYELKTLAQFYILGGPSLTPVKTTETKKVAGISVENRRLNLFTKGVGLRQTLAPAVKIKRAPTSRHKTSLNKILSTTGFKKKPKEKVYVAKFKTGNTSALRKACQVVKQLTARSRNHLPVRLAVATLKSLW